MHRRFLLIYLLLTAELSVNNALGLAIRRRTDSALGGRHPLELAAATKIDRNISSPHRRSI